eukprot:TRINITY_DN13143_c0_g1_i4.p1 TRINITY_DN13143_c0_g1~~TRINITY_DN13143_c0_g1_i4.p1  ORF type:complete len:383 (-),score=55.95 TRINITY_DN13143_c0_g1_i4:886-1932(-)
MAGPTHKKSYKQSHSLTEKCLVCTAPAPIHCHYGAVSCYPCRAFFRRGISRAYVCISGNNKCKVNNITRSNCKKCRLQRCLTVGMKPELVDTTLKRKEREKQMQENVDDRRFFLQEPENGKVHQLTSLHIAENKTKESLSECPRERQECHNQMDKHISKHSNSCDNHDKPQTFYIFDPRNNTYEPVIIVKQKENQKLDCIDNSDVVQDTLVIRDGTSISSYERAFNERRVSVIQKLESSQVENPKIANEKTTHLFNQKQEDCIDIEKIVDICFSEEIDKTEDCKTTDENNCHSIQEKRQRKLSTSVLPFKKRRTVHKLEFLSTAISKALIPAFTFEEEFRLGDLGLYK